jgi:tRNA A-37 threonylcarbamoyl transferase component Bud32
MQVKSNNANKSSGRRLTDSAAVVSSHILSRRHIWLWPILLGILLALGGWYTSRSVQSALRINIQEHLQTILNADTTALQIWLDTQESNAIAIASDPSVEKIVDQLIAQSQAVDFDPTSLVNSAHVQSLRDQIKPLLKAHKYHGFAVVDLAGRVLAADLDEPIGRNDLPIQSGLLDTIGAGKSTVTRPSKSALLLTDEEGQARVGRPTMFAAAPVRNHAVAGTSTVVAGLGIYIKPEEQFTEILSVARAGKTGETYAFGRDGLLLSQSRFDDGLRQIGLLVDDNQTKSILNISIRDPQVNMALGQRPRLPRSEQPMTLMAQSAIDHGVGCNVDGYRDYRGVPVVGAWRWLDKYGMGIATEVDFAEAYQPLIAVRTAFGALLGLLAATAMALLAITMVLERENRAARLAVIQARRLGHYILGEKLGEGGMGTVYRGRHDMLQRPTAVKLLDVDKTNEATIARFEHEVKITSRLQHPNTIAVYDYGRTPEGVFYYAMEYVEGVNLDVLIRQDGAQPDGRVIHILQQVCGSLSEAHRRGLIHRDIKPANVILTQYGGISDFVKVLDFGLVKELEATRQALTNAGTLAGTPLYMAPETIESSDTIDARADLYALGCVGYYLIAGEPVFQSNSILEVCRQHASATPPPLSQRAGQPLAPELERVLMQCLEKSPDDRPQTARAILDQLSLIRPLHPFTEQDAEAWWSARTHTTDTPVDEKHKTILREPG